MQAMTSDDLRRLARHGPATTDCAACAALACPGWESLPGGFDERALVLLGTLRDGSDEPTWAEHHPQGTRTDSPQAPIAPRFHPYNRSDVVACAACGRPFLRYTEFGGYYEDRRIRALDADRIVD